MSTVKVKLSGLQRFRKTVEADLCHGGRGPIRQAIHQWAARYRSFVQERFDKASKGGGGWKPLKRSTKGGRRKARRGAKGKRRFTILRDTGTLFAALSPTFGRKPGQLQQDIPLGVRVGYGGPARHPKGRATIADIARFHQEGAGNLPARTIIVDPPQGVQSQMASDMSRAVDKLARQANQ